MTATAGEHEDTQGQQQTISIGHIRHGELTLILEAEKNTRGFERLTVDDDIAPARVLDDDARPQLLDTLRGLGVPLFDGTKFRDQFPKSEEAPFQNPDGSPRQICPVSVDDNTVTALYTINLSEWVPNPFPINAGPFKDAILQVPAEVNRLRQALRGDGEKVGETGYRIRAVGPNWFGGGGNC